MSDLPVFAPLPAPVGEVEPLPLPPTLDEVRQLILDDIRRELEARRLGEWG